jgi:hypothetical protein
MTTGLQGFKPTPETERAMRIRQIFDRTCANIRADTDLSDSGKQRAMAAAYLKCAVSLAEIRAAESDATAARRSALELQVFGIGPGGPMAAADYRDAQDRAEQSTQPKEALRLLDRTTRTGDETLAKAIASHAVEMGWSMVLDQYASTRQSVHDALAELRRIDSETADSAARLARGAIYAPTKPPELKRLTNSMIGTLAATNDYPNATAGSIVTARSGQSVLGR